MCLRCSGKSREVSNRGRAETVKEACREEQRRTGSGARWAWDGAAVPAQGSRANAEGLPLLPFLRAAMASRAGRPASLPPSLPASLLALSLLPCPSFLPASPLPPLRPALSYPSHSYLPAALPGCRRSKANHCGMRATGARTPGVFTSRTRPLRVHPPPQSLLSSAVCQALF